MELLRVADDGNEVRYGGDIVCRDKSWGNYCGMKIYRHMASIEWTFIVDKVVFSCKTWTVFKATVQQNVHKCP